MAATQLPLVSWGVLAVSYGVGLSAILSSDAAWLWYFNADTLNFPSLYRDLFIDHFSPHGWMFSAAPFVFPDGLVYFAIQAMVPGFRLALYLFGFLQVFALAVSSWWIARSVLSGSARLAGGLCAILLGAIVVTLGGAWSRQPEWQLPMLRHLVLPVHHIGAFVVTLIGIGWTLRAMRDRLSVVETGIAAACLVAAVFSDRLLIPEFVLPAALVWSVSGDWRRAWRASALLAGTAILGAMAVGMFATDPGQALAGVASVTAIHRSALQLLHDVWNLKGASSVIRTVWAVGVLVAVVVIVRAWKSPPETRDLRWVPALFALAVPITVVASVLAKGLYKNVTTLHYFMGVWLLPILMLPILLMPRGVNRFALSGRAEIAIALAVVVLTLSVVRPSARRLHPDVTLPLAKCIDQLADSHRMRYGIAGYWEAKPIMLFSRRDVRVYQVTPGLTPRHWISNRLWHGGEPGSRFPDPEYTFVVLNDLDADIVLARFGEPARRAACPDGDVWIYDRPSDVAFHRQFR